MKVIVQIALADLKLAHRTKIGYLVIGVFLIVCSLLFWVVENPYNILSTGIGDLRPFFDLIPWLLALLIPAIGMKNFTDEIQNRTIEVLFSKPISMVQLVLGKFLGLMIFIGFSIIPLLIYFLTLQVLMISEESIEWISHMSALLGIFLTALVFTSITLCVSIIFNHSVLVFIISLIICCFQYYAWFYLAQFSNNAEWYHALNRFGILHYYNGLSRGILNISDMVYYLFNILFFLYLSALFLERIKFQK
ncbi:MAG: ABC transporter permease subunit [Flavobacteriaceae bacterium]|nr:ABC transporter permease subunit [Flavobacteriaceae bacterium]MCY4267515.1 ABC transporter permease subunit [Flavobacteriaceae bacterium]